MSECPTLLYGEWEVGNLKGVIESLPRAILLLLRFGFLFLVLARVAASAFFFDFIATTEHIVSFVFVLAVVPLVLAGLYLLTARSLHFLLLLLLITDEGGLGNLVVFLDHRLEPRVHFDQLCHVPEVSPE